MARLCTMSVLVLSWALLQQPAVGETIKPPPGDESAAKHARLRALEASHHLQEALWLAKSLGDFDKAAALQAALKAAFAAGQCRKVGPLRGGGSLAFKVNCQGVRGVFKPDRRRLLSPRTWFAGNSSIADARREIAAYVIDQLFDLDLVPYTTSYKLEGVHGSLQAYIEGMVEGPAFATACPTRPESADEAVRSVTCENTVVENWPLLLILDYLTANSDRHGGNVLFWQAERRAIAIDHGLIFSKVGFIKRVNLAACHFTLDDQVWRYAGLYDFDAPLQAEELPRGVHERLLTTSASDITASLQGLLPAADLEQLVARQQSLQGCL